ncbi:SixA phosphatase family protein [Streptomyces sp. NPDC090036]|uniref:SixA phosphatase family protein n=1 Tax=Streptomyces sp. NPDC090036 TaxID=3365926 RepID=UPI0038004040
MSPDTETHGTPGAAAADVTNRRLLLIRHAKAVPKGRTDDFERELSARGCADAAETGRWLEQSPFTAELVLCSPARRTRQTWQLAQAVMTDRPPAVYDERLYNAAASELAAVLADRGTDVGVLALIGHNSGLHELAASLCGEGPPELLEHLRSGFPTAGVAVVDLPGGWGALTPGRGTLTAFWPADGSPPAVAHPSSA